MLTFMHPRLGSGRATLAIKLDDKSATVAVAFCSPKDRFTRKLGRKIAQGRLEHGAKAFTLELGDDDALAKPKEAVWHKFVALLMAGDGVPRWACSAARASLDNLGR